MLNRILVPLDGSECAEAILPQLKRVAERHRTEIILFRALPLVPFGTDGATDQYLRRISFLMTNEGYPSNYILRRGLPAESILEAGQSEGVDLIALSTHGRSGMERWVLGSVAEKVLQGSPVPVFVARSFTRSISRGQLESQPVRNFLLPLDGSRLALESIPSILGLSRHVDAHVTLLHIDEPSPYDGRWESPDNTLKEAQEILRLACIPATVEFRKGDAAEQILKTVEEKAIDLVAMTTHGRSGPSRWIFGSVTAKVLRTSPVPLLVVRHQAAAAKHPATTAQVTLA